MKKLFNVLAVVMAVAVAVPVQAVQTRAQRAAAQAQQVQAQQAPVVVQPNNTTKIAVAAAAAGLTALAVTALYNAIYGEVDCGVVKAAYCAGSEVAPVAYELCKEHLPRWCAPGFLG